MADGILELRDKLDSGKVSSEELFNECVKEAKASQKDYNPFVTIMDKYEKVDSNSVLSGIPYVLKDNISTTLGIISLKLCSAASLAIFLNLCNLESFFFSSNLNTHLFIKTG